MGRDMNHKEDAWTRRDFIKTTAAGAAVASTTIVMKDLKFADASESENPPIRLSKEFTTSLSALPQKADFPMTGADVFAKVCLDEGLAALFTVPRNYNIIHSMANQGIRAISGRHEGLMAHAADGFIRGCNGGTLLTKLNNYGIG